MSFNNEVGFIQNLLTYSEGESGMIRYFDRCRDLAQVDDSKKGTVDFVYS